MIAIANEKLPRTGNFPIVEVPAIADADRKGLTKKEVAADHPTWCPGCGDFAVLACFYRVLEKLQYPHEKIVTFAGIGCSSRFPYYMQTYGMHSIHGRAPAIATGLKLARPELSVWLVTGDGDGLSIGGNHFLHACRRNADLTYLIMDNQVYGMTKGQASPTTGEDWTHSKLTPEGTGVTAIQPVELALACGASFIARGYAGDPNGVARLIAEGICHPGFAVIHILSPCVTYRPEQKAWKTAVHPSQNPPATDPRRALSSLQIMPLPDPSLVIDLIEALDVPFVSVVDCAESLSLSGEFFTKGSNSSYWMRFKVTHFKPRLLD